ncbi:MAG: hypothetical protein COA45_12400 [Zetaproteobacteria bacterium]|nr:MAG: hypothetical protein COA45_12400 [Zetaproteobacteria bacterium]
MQNRGKRENQHYVPQLLLRNFSFKGNGKVPQVHVFDKKDEKTFQTGVNNVLAEGRFYDLTKYSAEASFSKLESSLEPILTKIITERDISSLTDDEKVWVSVFVMAQYLRVKSFRTDAQEMLQGIVEKFGKIPDFTDKLSNSNEDVKDFSLKFIQENLSEMSGYILNKDWYILETKESSPFWIGDNPVTLHNENKSELYGNIGFGVQGIQIYLPLSSTLTLMFWCPSIKAELEGLLEKYSKMLNDFMVQQVMENKALYEQRGSINSLQKLMDDTKKIVEAIKLGKPKLASKENVEFYNSLQVYYAERYILSNKCEFSLAESMIKDGAGTKKWTFS